MKADKLSQKVAFFMVNKGGVAPSDMSQAEFNSKTLKLLVTLTKIIWSIGKIQLVDISEHPAPVARVLERALSQSLDEAVAVLAEFGVDTEPFEDFKIRTKAQENPNN